jgi:hypothetical protein
MRLFRSARLFLYALLIAVIPASAHAGIFISVGFAPPVLPVYVQPVCPAPNLMWTPGYWAYGPDGYYWVPGAWVPAPYVGALWTPGYWGWGGGQYLFHEGYWGRHVGYYGGVSYGFGYMGVGFAGGEWRGGGFAYNTAVMHVNTTVIHTTYVDTTIVHNTTIINNNHVAYSGGPGGVQHQPTPEEKVAEHETHVQPTKFQQQHVQTAQSDKQSYAKNNGGHPAHVVAEKPLAEEKHAPPPEHENTAAQHGQTAGTKPNPTLSHATPGTPAAHTPGTTPQSHAIPQTHPTPAPHGEMPESHTPPAPHTNSAPVTHNPPPAMHPAPQSHPAPAPHPQSHPAPPKPEPRGKGRR